MTDIRYDTYEGEYSERVALEFEYDERLADSMRELREDRHWGVTHCQPVYDGDDFDHWAIDRTAESIERFQEVAGKAVPAEFWPEGESPDGEEEVRIVVPEGETRFRAEGGGDDLDAVLYGELSYENPDAKHSSLAEPVIRLYDMETSSASMGLASRAADIVGALGYDAEVEVLGDRSGEPIDVSWEFEHDLRGYQSGAMASVLEHGGGIVALPTGAGKTVTALALVEEIGQEAVVFVHTKELLHQWADEVRECLGVEPGVIGDDEWSTGPVTICTMQTLMSKGVDRLDDPGVMIFDECHRTSAADTMHDIGMEFDSEWRIGLSATPWRRINGAELKIEGAVGGVAHEVTAEELIDEGYLAEPVFRQIGHPGPEAEWDEDYHEAYRRCIVNSDARNAAVATQAAELAEDGYRVLVNVDWRDHGEAIERTTRALGADAMFLHGGHTTEEREEALAEFRSRETPVLVSTLIKEGVDIPALDAVVLANAKRSDIQTLQVIGRALRTGGGGKDHALVVDIEDSGAYFRQAFEDRRDAMDTYYGSHGPSGEAGSPAPAESAFEDDDRTRSLSDPMTDEEIEEMEEWIMGMDG